MKNQKKRRIKSFEVSNLAIHRGASFWDFTFYNGRGLKRAKIRIASQKLKPIIQYLNQETTTPYYSLHEIT